MTIKETQQVIANGKANGESFIIFHDTETTGIKSTDRILQSAHALYRIKENNIEFIDFFEENITPPVPIGPASAAVHGIWYPDLEGCPEFQESQTKGFFDMFIKEGIFYCAHNSPFDIGQLEKEGVYYPKELVIDTLQVAKHVNKDNDDIESNGLQYLRYFYNFDMTEDFGSFLSDYKIEKLQPHTALSDIAVLAYYYKFLIEKELISDIAEAVRLTGLPVISDKVTFGNVFEKGTPISEAAVSTYQQYGKTKRGIDYFNWAINNMETMQADVKISVASICIDLLMQGKLENDKSIAPMKYIIAAFGREDQKEWLHNNAMNVQYSAEKTIAAIRKTVKSIEESGNVDEDRRYQSLTRLLSYI